VGFSAVARLRPARTAMRYCRSRCRRLRWRRGRCTGRHHLHRQPDCAACADGRVRLGAGATGCCRRLEPRSIGRLRRLHD
jgi:hypothetical protein